MPSADGISGLEPQKDWQYASQYDRRDKAIHLNKIPIPTPEPGQLLVKIASASLCHSDLMHFTPGTEAITRSPEVVTLGHEACGYVVSAPSPSSTFKPRDAVGFLPGADCCFECECCVNVHNAWCRKGGCSMQGFARDGYFQEYVVVDERQCITLPEELKPEECAPLFCAGVTAYHAIAGCKLTEGSWICIVGCGGLGHLGIQYAKALGLKVIAIDIAEEQLEEAKIAGADHTFNSATDGEYVAKILKITAGGCEAVANFTASKKSYDGCPSLLKMGTGLLMIVGIPLEPIHLNAFDIAMGRYRVKGANNGTPPKLRSAIEFSAKHNIRPHMTTYSIEEVPKMVGLMHDGKSRGRMGTVFR